MVASACAARYTCLMNRRAFLQVIAGTPGADVAALADAPMPRTTLGKRVSRIALGGDHMRVRGEHNGVKVFHRAIDLGVTIFGSAALTNAMGPSRRMKSPRLWSVCVFAWEQTRPGNTSQEIEWEKA